MGAIFSKPVDTFEYTPVEKRDVLNPMSVWYNTHLPPPRHPFRTRYEVVQDRIKRDRALTKIYNERVAELDAAEAEWNQAHELEGHSDVTRPPPPPRIHSLSELIDPAELPIDSHVRSPSGNLLAPEQYLVHPNRPRSMRERQQEIREKTRNASRLGEQNDKSQTTETTHAKDGKGKGKKPKWFKHLSCFKGPEVSCTGVRLRRPIANFVCRCRTRLVGQLLGQHDGRKDASRQSI